MGWTRLWYQRRLGIRAVVPLMCPRMLLLLDRCNVAAAPARVKAANAPSVVREALSCAGASVQSKIERRLHKSDEIGSSGYRLEARKCSATTMTSAHESAIESVD